MDKPRKHEGYITTREASVVLGVTTERVHQLKRIGILDGYKDGNFAYIKLESVEKLKSSGLLATLHKKSNPGCPYAGKGCVNYTAEMCDACPLPECKVDAGQAIRMSTLGSRRRKAEEKDWKYKHIDKRDLPPEYMAKSISLHHRRVKL